MILPPTCDRVSGDMENEGFDEEKKDRTTAARAKEEDNQETDRGRTNRRRREGERGNCSESARVLPRVVNDAGATEGRRREL